MHFCTNWTLAFNTCVYVIHSSHANLHIVGRRPNCIYMCVCIYVYGFTLSVTWGCMASHFVLCFPLQYMFSSIFGSFSPWCAAPSVQSHSHGFCYLEQTNHSVYLPWHLFSAIGKLLLFCVPPGYGHLALLFKLCMMTTKFDAIIGIHKANRIECDIGTLVSGHNWGLPQNLLCLIDSSLSETPLIINITTAKKPNKVWLVYTTMLIHTKILLCMVSWCS